MDQSHPQNTNPLSEQRSSTLKKQLVDGADELTCAGTPSKQNLPVAKNYSTREFLNIVGGSKATHFNRLNPKSRYYDPKYPRPIKNGRLSIYLASETAAYLTGRVTARDKVSD